MKNSLLTLFAMTGLFMVVSCNNDDDSTSSSSCGTVCQVPVASGETAATVPASIAGTYTLTYHEIVAGGPFVDGDVITLQLTSDNKMLVTFEEECVTIENPVTFGQGSTEANFRDNCVFNVIFGASATQSGQFDEVNVSTLNSGFLGQFTE